MLIVVAHLRGHLHNTNTTVDMVTHKLCGHLQICDVIVDDKFRFDAFR